MKIKRNTFDNIIDIVCLLCVVGTACYLLVVWKDIPSMIAGHYNMAGEIDRMTEKNSLLIMCMVGVIFIAGLSVVEHFPKIWNTGIEVTETNKDEVYRVLMNLLKAMKVIIAVAFTFLIIQMTQNVHLSLLFIFTFLGILIALFVYTWVQLSNIRKKYSK